MVVTIYVVILPAVAEVADLPAQPARAVIFDNATDAQNLVAAIPGATYHSLDVSDAL